MEEGLSFRPKSSENSPQIWTPRNIGRINTVSDSAELLVSIFIPGSWASFPCFCGARRKLLRSPWNLVVCNLRSIQNSSRLSDGCIFFISRHSRCFSLRIDYYICLHLWNLGKENTHPFTSLKVFVAFDSTKLCWKQQTQNKQSHSFLLHQKSSKSIY